MGSATSATRPPVAVLFTFTDSETDGAVLQRALEKAPNYLRTRAKIVHSLRLIGLGPDGSLLSSQPPCPRSRCSFHKGVCSATSSIASEIAPFRVITNRTLTIRFFGLSAIASARPP